MIADAVRHIVGGLRSAAMDVSLDMVRKRNRAEYFALRARHVRALADELDKLAVTVAELDADEPRERTGEI